MACEECEALCVLFKKHLAEVTVTKTNLSLVSYRARDTESLKSLTDSSSSVSSNEISRLIFKGQTSFAGCQAFLFFAARASASSWLSAM